MNSYLAKNIHLESIDVEDNNLQFKGISSLLKPLKGQERCGTFNFNGNNLTGQVCFFLAQVLAKNQNIYELHLGNNKVISLLHFILPPLLYCLFILCIILLINFFLLNYYYFLY